MNIQPDDPKWTAYVLGELDDAGRLEVEQELEAFPEAREIVEEIRMMSTLLSDELAAESPAALLPEQRKSVRDAIAVPRWWRRQWVPGLAAAAVIVLAITLPALLRSRQIPVNGTVAGALQNPAVPVDPSLAVPPGGGNPAPLEPGLRAGGQIAAAPPATVNPAASAADEGKPYEAASAEASKENKSASLDSLQKDLSDSQRVAVAGDAAMLGGNLKTQQNSLQPPAQIERQQLKALEMAPPSRPSPSAAPSTEGGRIITGFPASGLFTPPLAGPGTGGGRGGAAGRLPAAPNPPVRIDGFNRPPAGNTEAYDRIDDNPFKSVAEDPLATFSIDVDTASYANVRRFLNQNQLPPRDSVRIEELVNYFNYDYAPPTGPHPIAVHSEVAAAPWQPDHRLVRIGIKAKDIDMSRRPPSNLVFLIDVSGSMMPAERLPLLKRSLKLLIDKLTENDRVAIVVYAGNSGLALPSTSGDKKELIVQTLDRLEAGGSTNGASGIQLAYQTAVTNFIRGGINRVILCTDGDFNVGVTNQGELTRLIEDRAKSGVFLSVLGFGMGNLKDSTMEKLADKGNGNYAYIDSLNEGRKVLVEEMGGTLMTIAKDVKIQVDFNPAQVNAYRLIGYENRVLRDQDFNDDSKDAGDMGAGQTVTALFEIVPNGVAIGLPTVDASKYAQTGKPNNDSARGKNESTRANAAANELLTVRVRYKQPDAADSTRFDVPLVDRRGSFESATTDFHFAAAVAEFGMILRGSPYASQASLDHVIRVADRSRGFDRNGYREEFVGLALKTRALLGRRE